MQFEDQLVPLTGGAGDVDVFDESMSPLCFWKETTTLRDPGTPGAAASNLDTECYRSFADTARQLISRKCGTSGTKRKIC